MNSASEFSIFRPVLKTRMKCLYNQFFFFTRQPVVFRYFVIMNLRAQLLWSLWCFCLASRWILLVEENVESELSHHVNVKPIKYVKFRNRNLSVAFNLFFPSSFRNACKASHHSPGPKSARRGSNFADGVCPDCYQSTKSSGERSKRGELLCQAPWRWQSTTSAYGM